MIFEILLTVGVVSLFIAAFVWGQESRTGFTNPRQREPWILNRRNEYR